jgi:hypothetical protein
MLSTILALTLAQPTFACVSTATDGAQRAQVDQRRGTVAVLDFFGEKIDVEAQERLNALLLDAVKAPAADPGRVLTTANRVLVDAHGQASAAILRATRKGLQLSWVGGFGLVRTRGSSTTRETLPHSLIEDFISLKKLPAAEQELVRLEAPHRNVVVRALGPKPEVTVEAAEVEVGEGDRVALLDLDLFSTLTLDEVRDGLSLSGSPEKAAAGLVAVARQKDPGVRPMVCVGFMPTRR